MKERIAIVYGLRTPFGKAGGVFKHLGADDLGAAVVRELMARTNFPVRQLDEVIFGNATQPVEAINIARVIALKAGLPDSIPAYTVQRNCASGMESLTTAANKILAGEAEVILAGSTESMSRIPLFFSEKMSGFFSRLMKAKNFSEKLTAYLSFRPSFLKPVVGLELGLTDPICNLNMGQTAEVLAREFGVTREEQDRLALLSHQRAAEATQSGRLAEEMMPIPAPPDYTIIQKIDEGIRPNQSYEALAKLKPYFDRVAGVVTAGNSSQVSDGAAATLLMTEKKAKTLGLSPLGYIRGYSYAGCEGRRMGLGPLFATSKLLDKTGLKLNDFSLVELNEAFAAQVIACEKAFGSKEFAQVHLGKGEALGNIDRERLNVNGGAIALGHPVGASGTRLIITLLKELGRRGENLGLATACIGGGQGAAMALEVM